MSVHRSKKRVAVLIPYFDFVDNAARAGALDHAIGAAGERADIFLVSHRLPKAQRLAANHKHLTVIELKAADVVWQKERFLNIALRALKPCHEWVAWIDADVVFRASDWTDRLIDALDRYALVQLFDEVVDVDTNLTVVGAPLRSVVTAHLTRGLSRSYFGSSGVSRKLGLAPGFAWGSRTATMRAIGFPDFMCLGSGDKALLAAALGHHKAYAQALELNAHLRDCYLDWADRAHRVIQGRIGHIQGRVDHVRLGDYDGRQYASRYSLLAHPGFNPNTLLACDPGGAWLWSQANPFAPLIRDYFAQRGD